MSDATSNVISGVAGNESLLILPMGAGIEHAGVQVSGLSLDVVVRYATDERLPEEQRAEIMRWLESQTKSRELADVSDDDGPDDSDFA